MIVTGQTLSMILYHFTASHLVPRIKSEGLIKGALPWNFDKHGKPQMIPGFQWLTSSAEWDQPFALLGSLPYSRNAWRLTIAIPNAAAKRLHRWEELCRRCQPDCAVDINQTAVDWENWYVFAGRIPCGWIVASERNPGQALRPDDLLISQ